MTTNKYIYRTGPRTQTRNHEAAGQAYGTFVSCPEHVARNVVGKTVGDALTGHDENVLTHILPFPAESCGYCQDKRGDRFFGEEELITELGEALIHEEEELIL